MKTIKVEFLNLSEGKGVKEGKHSDNPKMQHKRSVSMGFWGKMME